MKKIFFTIIFTIFCLESYAQLSFEVKNQNIDKTKILFFGFNGQEENIRSDSQEILTYIRKNLSSTNLFEIINDEGNIENNQENQDQNASNLNPLKNNIISSQTIPDFKKYRQNDVGAIIVAQINYDISGNIEIKMRLWDALDERQIFGKLFSSSKENYKKLANVISDEIFQSLTGEKQGHFNSKILYISQSGNIFNRVKKIVMVDFDGQNRKVLTDGRDLVLTPVFAKKKNEIFFLSYRSNNPQIYKMNFGDAKQEKIGSFQGTTFAASPHPKDSNIILISAIFDGNSDIYKLNIKENQATRLTKNPAIDTTASYSFDGEKIAFISDRDGGQKIYLMDDDGSNVRKITFEEGSYSKPNFSPDGTMIAFTLMKNKQFYAGTMSANGANQRILTSGYLIEGVKFSPNGRYLIYSKIKEKYGKQSIPRLYTIDITNGYEYEIPLPENEGATDPDWSLRPN